MKRLAAFFTACCAIFSTVADGVNPYENYEKTLHLKEVVVKPKKEKYSKKDNPAVNFMKLVGDSGRAADPRLQPSYNYQGYDRITLALNNLTQANELLKMFPQMLEHLDVSEVSGSTILNISVKEKASEVYHRSNPVKERVVITGYKRRGIDEQLEQGPIQTFIDDVFREVDIYENDINILQNRFVSPLGRLAPDFYKYYLTDTIQSATGKQVVLTFVPRTAESFGFTGRMYVDMGDSTLFLRRVEMGVPHNINLNFVSKMYLNQEFERGERGARFKTRDDMVLELSVLGSGFYVRRNSAYANHNFEEAPDSLFNGLQTVYEHADAENRDDSFWETHRLIPISASEASMGQLMTELRKNKVFYYSERIVKHLFTGYIGTGLHGKPSKFDIGPTNTTLSYNSLEGVRIRAGGVTTAAISKRWFARGYAAWGTRDHRWKYLAEIEHSFTDKKLHPREFPVHSIAVTSMYDLNRLGQRYYFTNPDNFVLSLKRKPDHQITYHYVNKFTYTLELWNNFSLMGVLGHERQQSTAWMPFRDGRGKSFEHYDEAYMELSLRYAPGEKFFQSRSQRMPVNKDAPIIQLTQTFAPRGFLHSRYTLNKTELSAQKRFWFSAFGFADVIVKGGHVWSVTPYPNLLIPNTNLSFTIQPESFALMNAMEFINDSYASWDVTYWANGAIFNYIPLLKKAKLREVFAFRGIFGHLSDKNRPWLNPELFRFPEDAHTRMMTSTPYMEISAGLDNLFKCLRLDYVWRLTYRNDYNIDRSGLRLAVHITF